MIYIGRLGELWKMPRTVRLACFFEPEPKKSQLPVFYLCLIIIADKSFVTLENFRDNIIKQRMASRESQEAFNVFYKSHFTGLYHYARKLVVNTHVAEDIIAESFLKIWERFSIFPTEQAAKSYLLKMVRNACLNAIRDKMRLDHRERIFSEISHHIENDAEITGRVFQIIYDEIERLPLQEKKVFKLAYLEEKTNEEIALMLNINNQSVRNYKARALKTLRNTCKERNAYSAFLLFTHIHTIPGLSILESIVPFV